MPRKNSALLSDALNFISLKRVVASVLTLAISGVLSIFAFVSPALSATTNAGTEAELVSAITSSASGDTINLIGDIVVSSQISISKPLTIDGNGYTISVPKPGVTEAGANELSPSTHRVFNLSGTVTITIKDVRIKGGNTQGAGINVGSGTTAIIDGVSISNSRNSSGGGGGVYNGGTTYLKNSNIIRNSALYGGGFINPGGKTMYVSNSMISDNRSESSAGGGGGAENQGTMYINNSSFSNNSSTEIGGAVNNYRGILYVSGSSFTGNIAYGSYGGGALGNNGGTMTIASSLMAHNYSRSAGTVSAPTAFDLDDVGIKTRSITTGSGVTLFYSIHHAAAAATNATINATNTAYSGLANGSDNSIFAGGTFAKVRNGSGGEIGTAEVFQPYVVIKNGRFAPALGLESLAAGKGTQIRFNATSGATSYYDRTAGTPAWVNLTPSSAQESDLITIDQYGENRQTIPAAGAVELEFENLYQVRAIQSSGGSVSGASIFGDVYPADSNVTITAIPDSGKTFSSFTVESSSSSTVTTNPFVLTVTAPTVITPTFTTSAAGEYTVSYSGNSAECGAPPLSETSTTSKTIAGNTSINPLQRAGFAFSGWNTQPNGSGTDYAAGDTYATATNLNLYAKWVANSGVTTTCISHNSTPSPTPTPTTSSSATPTPTPTTSSSTTPTPTPTSTSGSNETNKVALSENESDEETVTAIEESDGSVTQNNGGTPSAPLTSQPPGENREVSKFSGYWLLAALATLALFLFLVARRRKNQESE